MGWRPDAQMVLGQWDRRVAKCVERTSPIKPGRCDEAGDGPSDHVLDQRAATSDPLGRILLGKPEEFAFAGGHEACPQPVGYRAMLAHVAMVEAVKEHLDAFIGPAAEARRKGGAGDQG